MNAGRLSTTLATTAGTGVTLPPGLVVLGLILAAALLVGTVMLRGLGRRAPAGPAWQRYRFDADQRGTASLEFTLVLPFIMVLALMLTQVTLLMGSNLVVNYAAFAATRSAIVWIPADVSPTEPPNTILHAAGGTKLETIRRAAVFAVLPVAGRSTEGNANANALADGLESYFAAYGQSPPSWTGTLMPERLRYADANTSVTLLNCIGTGDELTYNPMGVGEGVVYGPRDPVTVRVTHRLALAVPYVRAFFADGTLDDGSKYSLVEAQYTLTNEGTVDQLPPRPELPRLP